jgi:hypothetical protein
MFVVRSLALISIACACSLVVGCASGPSQGTDAGHERPPRPDTGVLVDADGSPDAAGIDGGSSDGGSLLDGGSPLDVGAALDGGTSTDAAVSVDSRPATDALTRCCTTTADCDGFGVCVTTSTTGPGTCQRALTGGRGDCWTDADCTGGQTCGGGRMTECTNLRGFVDDSPGRCR